MMWRGQLPVGTTVCTHDGSAANGQWYCLYLQEVVYGTTARNQREEQETRLIEEERPVPQK